MSESSGRALRPSSSRRRGITPAMPSLAVCWTGAVSVVFRFRGTRPAMPRWLPAGWVRRPLSSGSGDNARHAPLAVCWMGAASVVFQFRGTRPACARHALRPSSSRRRGITPAMPCVRLLDGCGVRRLLDGGGITPACPASVQALRYYRAGGRANGRHPRRASPFLKF